MFLNELHSPEILITTYSICKKLAYLILPKCWLIASGHGKCAICGREEFRKFGSVVDKNKHIVIGVECWVVCLIVLFALQV